jgi:predicted NAD/FAD-dependent oxidoreductase
MNAIAKNLAIGLDVRTASQVAALRHDGESWKVALVDGSELVADAVIATSPVPQTIALLQNGEVTLAAKDEAALEAIEYDPCLAFMAVLDGPSGLAEPGAIDPVDGPIDWMADNYLKGISAVPAVTIHATPEFSRAQWDASDEVITEALLDAAQLESSVLPGSIQIQRWRYARPSVEHPERFLQLSGVPPFVCAGDAFGGAKVEGAALSGAAAAEAIENALGGSS